MLIATSYPFGGIVLTMVIFFAFVIWLFVLFAVLADLFRRHDIRGVAKVAWILVLVLLPFAGVFVYLIFEHRGMSERSSGGSTSAMSGSVKYG